MVSARRNVFERVCPEVETIRVEIRPIGEGFKPFREGSEVLIVYTENSVPPILNCRNPRCYGGGVDLDQLIRWFLVQGRHTEFEDLISCCGYEGSPKGRRNDGPCDTKFRVKVAIKYKNEAKPV